MGNKYILINNCHECPFCNNDNEYGKDSCNLHGNIYSKNLESMPEDKVHSECPLLLADYTISFN